jgi:hypothetical protein
VFILHQEFGETGLQTKSRMNWFKVVRGFCGDNDELQDMYCLGRQLLEEELVTTDTIRCGWSCGRNAV